jgi:hypothetical protein
MVMPPKGRSPTSPGQMFVTLSIMVCEDEDLEIYRVLVLVLKKAE